MSKRKENLIANLELVIHGLKTDTIHYKWNDQQSCNCGLVAQTLLKVDASELKNRISGEGIFRKASLSSRLGIELEKVEPTWRLATQAYCPLTGEPLKKIFKDLEEAGLSKEDIVHLEYMTNDAILKRSGIKTVSTSTKQVQTGTKKTPKWGAFGKLIDAVREEPIYESKIVEIPIRDYHQNKENLIKYLSAWVQILKNEAPTIDISTSEDINSLKELLLNKLADQSYEEAAVLRDRINNLELKV